jgi:malate dehydrogenase (oxaloacetate-decarboxylating)
MLGKKSLEEHRRKRGKLEIVSKFPLKTKEDLSIAYTPGVAAVSSHIAGDKDSAYEYTIKGNSVAVVTDGSAVLGLGNIGPQAALPVMEGKCILFKKFAGIDAYPICLDTQDADDIVAIVKRISPGFAGINLEDISAPKCFEIERKLQDIGIPVFHDDQHGTAVVVLAALINAAKLAGKSFEYLRIVISGAGAAGTAVANLLTCFGMDEKVCRKVSDVILVDTKGIIYEGRKGLNPVKADIAKRTNHMRLKGGLKEALLGSDVFIGVSAPGVLKPEMVKLMGEKPIIFALANPIPEIMPEEAEEAGAFIVGTGRSDYPNQINNVLAFPGILRGALDAKAVRITNSMKIAAAHALAGCINPKKDAILPNPLDKAVARKVAEAVRTKAIEEGVVRKAE